MGFSFRKSKKIAPGLRLNLSKSGLGLSAGVRGARVGKNTPRGAWRDCLRERRRVGARPASRPLLARGAWAAASYHESHRCDEKQTRSAHKPAPQRRMGLRPPAGRYSSLCLAEINAAGRLVDRER